MVRRDPLETSNTLFVKNVYVGFPEHCLERSCTRRESLFQSPTLLILKKKLTTFENREYIYIALRKVSVLWDPRSSARTHRAFSIPLRIP